MTEEPSTNQPSDTPEHIPELTDPYVEAVGQRLVHNYDLEGDYTVNGERFDLYGYLEVHNQRQVLHPALSVGHHESREHVFLKRTETLSEADLDRMIELGHALAEEWITADEEHYSTEFIFVFVCSSLSDPVSNRIEELDERTLLKFGYHGHYDIHIAAVDPAQQHLVSNAAFNLTEAVRTWEPVGGTDSGLMPRVVRRLIRGL